jgi:hypothetical protein
LLCSAFHFPLTLPSPPTGGEGGFVHDFTFSSSQTLISD